MDPVCPLFRARRPAMHSPPLAPAGPKPAPQRNAPGPNHTLRPRSAALDRSGYSVGIPAAQCALAWPRYSFASRQAAFERQAVFADWSRSMMDPAFALLALGRRLEWKSKASQATPLQPRAGAPRETPPFAVRG